MIKLPFRPFARLAGVVTPLPRRVDVPKTAPLLFSFCTLVNDRALYDRFLRSFTAGGFHGNDVEYLYIDNTMRNTHDAYSGLNCLISHARGRYVVLCHQDVALIRDKREKLEACLSELEAVDPNWALAGNAGSVSPKLGNIGELAVVLTDIDGTVRDMDGLPLRAHSLDENFIVMKNSARLAFSEDLRGYHMYGLDLCLQAEVRGLTAYVMNFHLLHDGKGSRKGYDKAQIKLERKYMSFFRARDIQTTCSWVDLRNPPKPQSKLKRKKGRRASAQ
jgi:hypothetical protein